MYKGWACFTTFHPKIQWKPKDYWILQLNFRVYGEGISSFLYKFAAAAKLIEATADLILSHSLNLYVPHAIQTRYLPRTPKIFCLQLISYEILLLSLSCMTIQHYLDLHPTSLFSFLSKEQAHSCTTIKQSIIPFYTNLTETPLKDPIATFFAYGTYLRHTNGKSE